MNMSSILLDYRSEEYIESIIVLTVIKNFSMNGTELKCGISDLINNSVKVQFDVSGMSIRMMHSLPVSVILHSLVYAIFLL